ncbi:TetR family transcriptional regulator [Glaciihabitans sp. UYNi722]|uniref:TetR family transcriptional regulator n=1 Tax=Glaciihabitans sp. UYNi722 TaxID=3156344 RepID=UPI003398CF46
MPRWSPDAELRLRAAAFELFEERGFDSVTIAEITDRAGLTRRSFFRYFPDKREVLFSGSEKLPAIVEEMLANFPAEIAARDAIFRTLSEIGNFLLQDRNAQAFRQQLIDSSSELRERERTKMAAFATSITNGLFRRGNSSEEAQILGVVAAEIFRNAYVRALREADVIPFERQLDASLAPLALFGSFEKTEIELR